MLALLEHHGQSRIAQLVHSALPSTRAFWRTNAGFEQFAEDPRPLAECITLGCIIGLPRQRPRYHH